MGLARWPAGGPGVEVQARDSPMVTVGGSGSPSASGHGDSDESRRLAVRRDGLDSKPLKNLRSRSEIPAPVNWSMTYRPGRQLSEHHGLELLGLLEDSDV